jgi:tryptophanyl-tRNA synthetase
LSPRWLQEVFDVPLVIMLTDDEKYMHTPKLEISDSKRFTAENAKDIIGIGFDPAKTFIFSDFEYVSGAFYENICRMAKRITINSVRATFGFNDSNNIGEYHFCATQSATSFATSFPHIFGSDPLKTRSIPCLIPCAIDQDPYFRQCREHAEKMKYKKPSLIHSIFLPALQGPGSKMSASVDISAIFLTDTPNQIKIKINKYAFSGGQDTAEKQRELGGRTKDDVSFQYLNFFMEDDDELERIRQSYEKGELLTGELKAICIKHLQEYVAGFQERRKKVTEEMRREFMTVRGLTWGGNPNPIPPELPEKKGTKKREAKEKGGLPNGEITLM